MNQPQDSHDWMEFSDPVRLVRDPWVSVTISTYQHTPWIAQAIEGVLGQRCAFPFEVIIGEDGSTDGTLDICRDYQRKYPETIRLLAAGRNTGSKANLHRIFSQVRGRYHALCEGDDWWCDPLKLQDQVSFLETHPECSLSFSRTRIVRETESGQMDVGCIGPDLGKILFTPPEFLKTYLAHTSSLVFRPLPAYPDWFWDPRCLGDNALHLLCMERGSAGFLDRITSVYRITGLGIWSSSGDVARARAIRDSTQLLCRHVQATVPVWGGLIEYRYMLAEIKLARAMLKAGLKAEARKQWRDIVTAGAIWHHPRLWWKALKLAARVR